MKNQTKKNGWKLMLNFENIVISKTSYQKIVFPWVDYNEN